MFPLLTSAGNIYVRKLLFIFFLLYFFGALLTSKWVLILRVKINVTEFSNTESTDNDDWLYLDDVNRLDITEEKISELEETEIETIQNEALKIKWTMSSRIMYM